ncbi:MAG: hypothetical protein ACFFFC_08905, partial [Candidatus Thorarchaeota archaeon]
VTNLGESLAWGIAIGLILVLLAGSVAACVKVAASENVPEYAAPYDTSRITRIVREKTTSRVVEHIVSGTPDATFRQACEDRWLFESIDKDEDWIIQDSKSNDITDKPLVDCNDIASIIVFSSTPETSEEADHLPEWWDT